MCSFVAAGQPACSPLALPSRPQTLHMAENGAFGHCRNVSSTCVAGKDARSEAAMQWHTLSPTPGRDVAKSCLSTVLMFLESLHLSPPSPALLQLRPSASPHSNNTKMCWLPLLPLVSLVSNPFSDVKTPCGKSLDCASCPEANVCTGPFKTSPPFRGSLGVC